jgi:hypothetical protein
MITAYHHWHWHVLQYIHTLIDFPFMLLIVRPALWPGAGLVTTLYCISLVPIFTRALRLGLGVESQSMSEFSCSIVHAHYDRKLKTYQAVMKSARYGSIIV